MSATIHTFPGATAFDSDRLEALNRRDADANDLAAELGSPLEWTSSAFDHLKIASCERADGSVTVSAAALHLVLTYIEELEAREVSGEAS